MTSGTSRSGLYVPGAQDAMAVMVSITLLVYYGLSTQGIGALSDSDPAVNLNSPSTCDDLRHCRTTWNIIWSCLTTIIACTWFAVHSNIPSPNDTRLAIVGRQAKVVVVALIAPEFIVAWAMKQWVVASRLAREHRAYGWTRVHGFFAGMGGFMLFEGNNPDHIILPESNALKVCLKSGDINVTEEEIGDHSKRNVLSKALKAFVVVQMGWFGLQCITRGFKRLPITKLEILTLAFAALNFIICGLWWDKPYGVGRPMPVRRVGPSAEKDEEGSRRKILDALAGVYRSIWHTTVGALASVWTAYKDDGVCGITRTLWRAFKDACILRLFVGIAGAGDDGDRCKVDTFYSGKLEQSEKWLVYFVTGATVSIFGAIHCTAWSFHFPSRTEQIMWRVCSIAITSTPALGFAVAITSSTINTGISRLHRIARTRTIKKRMNKSRVPDRILQLTIKLSNIVDSVFVLTVFCQVVLYILARVTLLVLAFMSLRSLESNAYRTVSWTTLIPHI